MELGSHRNFPSNGWIQWIGWLSVAVGGNHFSSVRSFTLLIRTGSIIIARSFFCLGVYHSDVAINLFLNLLSFTFLTNEMSGHIMFQEGGRGQQRTTKWGS